MPAAELEGLTERGLAVAREHAGPMGPPASLLDQTVLTVSGPAGSRARPPVRIPLRCLFALSGMGFLGARRGRGDRAGVGDPVVAAPRRPLRGGGAPPDHRASPADLTAREPELCDEGAGPPLLVRSPGAMLGVLMVHHDQGGPCGRMLRAVSSSSGSICTGGAR